ncbi:putative lipoprotein [Mycobacterium xenopi 4042]|uniref:Putative lipoprotein n=1 Tax=Mycobacterium xenopi 4042 TaxID=1299334 RepID=X8AQ92_MYCXE|nr:putative lipoprotein [Mycobacterium xenopi 4042]
MRWFTSGYAFLLGVEALPGCGHSGEDSRPAPKRATGRLTHRITSVFVSEARERNARVQASGIAERPQRSAEIIGTSSGQTAAVIAEPARPTY